jgi:hypothetical protein
MSDKAQALLASAGAGVAAVHSIGLPDGARAILSGARQGEHEAADEVSCLAQ